MSTFRVLLATYAVVFLALAINPVERDTWFAENLTVWIIVGTLLVLRRRGVTFTPLAYALMFVLVILHTIGGHYTFARVPFGWVTDLFGFQRNHYDRIAHFSVGLYAFAIAELLDTRRLVANRALLALCPVAFIAAVAALYEIIEWAYAVLSDPAAGDAFLGSQGDAFLGSQGDSWDAQKDMLADTLGAIAATLLYFALRRPDPAKSRAGVERA